MTRMIIDNRATAKRRYEGYDIDRKEYATMQDLADLVDECMNKDVYKISIEIDGYIVYEKLNEVA